ncbi:MAG: hypothetical protein ABIZ80_10000, partial [Bryobacteraceae bacterium]
MDQLARPEVAPAIRADLASTLRSFVGWISNAGLRMRRISQEYEASGGRIFSEEEILQEVNDRRVSNR